MIQKGNLPKDYFAADVDRSKCLLATSSNAFFCTHYVGNMIYHKFSHDDISYRINGENVYVMLEYLFISSQQTNIALVFFLSDFYHSATTEYQENIC